MQTYLVIADFRRRKNKRGDEYGMPVSIMLPPESIWGYDMVTTAYSEKPEESWKRIFEHVKEMYPGADDAGIIRLIGNKPQ
jgi:hypothetical protein